MASCQACGRSNLDGVTYCDYCGSPLPVTTTERDVAPPTPEPRRRPVLTGAPLRDVDFQIRIPPGLPRPSPPPNAPPLLAFVECLIRQPCTVEWSAMAPTFDPDVRHCGQCDRDVHAVRTSRELDDRRAAGDCVAVFEVDRSPSSPLAWRPLPKPR